MLKLSMEPAVMVSLINMKLRNQFSSLNELCAFYELSKAELLQTVAKYGYVYTKENQLKAI
ncbi:DUF4250 domain-containing protein [Thalassotalea agarivorans]|uniref:DUF4250 domain-containing protein n=1 Tax=Thalassotalea agarivorans TaxID=349064 RepID=A0A1I0DCI9_THASX|nr:DUF4250 domain-containing protein [Thalassotalea agarivorans]SET29830.1 protein of unknown function [Thalassotalea agarivorans]